MSASFRPSTEIVALIEEGGGYVPEYLRDAIDELVNMRVEDATGEIRVVADEQSDEVALLVAEREELRRVVETQARALAEALTRVHELQGSGEQR